MVKSAKKPRKATYIRPFLFWYQLQFVDNPQRFTVVEACTKVGKTVAMIVWLLEQALGGKAGYQYWWVAPVRAQAKIAFDRLKRYMPVRNFFIANETNLTLTLPNGAVIAFKSAESDDTLYGDDVHAAVFDEFTRAREKAWFALRSTLTSTGGKCKFIGNVRGKGWGYKLAQKAKNGGDPEYAYFKVTAWDAVMTGGLDSTSVIQQRERIMGSANDEADVRRMQQVYDNLLSYAYAPRRAKDTKKRLSLAEVLQAKSDLPRHVFRELYEAEPAEDGTNPFGIKNLDAAKRARLAEGPAVAIGVDLAKRRDFTVEIGLNKSNSVCLYNRYQLDWESTKNSLKRLPNVPTAIDRTGVGDPVVESAQKGRSNVEGFVFTAPSKQLLLEDLAAGFQNGELSFPEGTELEDELYSFEYEYTRTGVRYSAPEGLHDDCVMALALAYRQRRNRPQLGPQQSNTPLMKPGAFGGNPKIRF